MQQSNPNENANEESPKEGPPPRPDKPEWFTGTEEQWFGVWNLINFLFTHFVIEPENGEFPLQNHQLCQWRLLRVLVNQAAVGSAQEELIEKETLQEIAKLAQEKYEPAIMSMLQNGHLVLKRDTGDDLPAPGFPGDRSQWN